MHGALARLLTVSFSATTLPDDDHFGLALHGDILRALEARDPAGAARAFDALIDFADVKLAAADRLRRAPAEPTRTTPRRSE